MKAIMFSLGFIAAILIIIVLSVAEAIREGRKQQRARLAQQRDPRHGEKRVVSEAEEVDLIAKQIEKEANK